MRLSLLKNKPHGYNQKITKNHTMTSTVTRTVGGIEKGELERNRRNTNYRIQDSRVDNVLGYRSRNNRDAVEEKLPSKMYSSDQLDDNDQVEKLKICG